MIMNKIKYLLIAAVGAVLCLASCKKEVYAPGEPDETGCYGVYFPEGQGDEYNLDPTDDKVISFKAIRTLTEGEITVPVTFTATYEGEDGTKTAEEIFDIDNIVFEDGQDETTFNVVFPNAAVGTTYTCSISLSDGEYVSKYGLNPVAIDFTVSRVKWNRVYGENGEEYGSWRDDFIAGVFGLEYVFNDKVEVYERDDNKGYYRLKEVYTAAYLDLLDPEYAPYESGCPEGTYTYIDATDPQNVILPKQSIGIDFSYGDMSIFSIEDENGVLEDGVVTFPQKGCAIVLPSLGTYYANTAGKFVFILPGAVMSDYSIAVKVGAAEDGDLPVAFSLGADVTKAVYGVYEGKLDDGEIYENRVALESDEDANTVDLENPSIVLSDMATGYYTIIAVSFDKDGNPSKNTSETFSYIAKGEEVPVVVSCGVNSAEKYVPAGKSTDNTIEFYVYGENLTEVKFGAVKKVDIVSDSASVAQKIIASKAVDKDVLKAINGTGYVGTVSGLLPGTEYHLVVYASNGYESTVKVSESSVTTTGDPLPIYENYTADDIDDDLLPATSEGYFGKYNFYAVDHYGKLGLREYISKVTIADSELPDSDEDDYGLKDEFVEISGIFDILKKKVPTFDGTMTWDCYDGVIYTLGQPSGIGNYGSYYVYPWVCEETYGPYTYEMDYAMYGGFVKDGYIAFVSGSSKVNFNGIAAFAHTSQSYDTYYAPICWYTDLLLVDETKDDNRVTPAGAKASANVSATTAELHRISKEISSVKFNCVQPEKIQIREAIRKAKSSVRIYTDFIGAEGKMPVKAAEFKVRAGEPAAAGATSGTASHKLRADLKF